MSELATFMTTRRLVQEGELEPRFIRRLSDQITTSFYDACMIGNLDAARQLMLALELVVARSTRSLTNENRDDGDDVAAVHARFELEVKRQAATTQGLDSSC